MQNILPSISLTTRSVHDHSFLHNTGGVAASLMQWLFWKYGYQFHDLPDLCDSGPSVYLTEMIINVTVFVDVVLDWPIVNPLKWTVRPVHVTLTVWVASCPMQSSKTMTVVPHFGWPIHYLGDTIHLRVIFERPEITPGSLVAQTQKVLFLCSCCSPTLVPSLYYQNCRGRTTGRLKETEWR